MEGALRGRGMSGTMHKMPGRGSLLPLLLTAMQQEVIVPEAVQTGKGSVESWRVDLYEQAWGQNSAQQAGDHRRCGGRRGLRVTGQHGGPVS